MINHRKCAIVPLVPRAGTGARAFDLLVYGRTAAELSTVPNDVIASLARRYPDHTSSPFLLRDA